MKKVIILLIIIFLGASSYYFYNNIYIPSQKPTIEIEKNKVTITKYYIYGTHLNIEGNIKKINAKFKTIDLILWNTKTGKIKKYKINYNKNINNVDFNISDEINKGIYLDDINKGNYELFLRFTYEDKKEKTYKYYSLDNTTDYKKITYYSLSKNNNKIIISKDDSTMTMNIKENSDKNIYDVVIDPSAGGIDKGAIGNGHKESDITLEYANKIKEKLEEKKIKVKLTRTKDSLKDNEYFDEYNDGGRAVIPHEVNAKYLFSLEANSSTNKGIQGFGISTAVGINYDFVANIVENITNKTGMKTSSASIPRPTRRKPRWLSRNTILPRCRLWTTRTGWSVSSRSMISSISSRKRPQRISKRWQLSCLRTGLILRQVFWRPIKPECPGSCS